MSKWASEFVNTNGIQIHFNRTSGGGKPLILVHGITDNGLCWTRLAKSLELEYDIIMIDARGHGHSDACEKGDQTQGHAADLAGLIETLRLDKPSLIGHSMGASNVAVLAGNYPDLVGKIILEDPPWRSCSSISTREKNTIITNWRQDIVETRKKTREDIMEYGRIHNPTWDEIEFGPWADSKKLVNPDVLGFLSETTSWQEDVQKVKCSSLLLTADVDCGAIVSPEVAESVVVSNANFQMVHIEGAGHNIRREQFEKYVELIRDFLPDTGGSKR